MTGKTGGKSCNKPRKMAITSRWATVNGRRGLPIRKKIIGRDMRVPLRSIAEGGSRQHLRGALVLLQQPAREHGTGIFFQPLIEQRADLLAEIGGMAEAREFVTLQRSA
jgi:hypothetical protein